MKLHRLELTGFGPFRQTQVVDFDAFDADGVFLISGRTGAGKSSILDGVSFALYGSVPRYDGGERRLRSDHCFLGDETWVRLEFTAGERRWRVKRAPEYDRPAKRGGGLTTEPPSAELEERVAGVWHGRAAKPRDVAALLDEVLGLNAQQFQQVILLAQNRFSRFLLAGNDERQLLLRTLFDTRRFERYEAELEQRRRDAQAELTTAAEHARTLLDLAERLIDEHGLGGEDQPEELTARRAAADVAAQRADYRAETLGTQRERADAAAVAAATAHAERVARAKTLAELDGARGRLAALEEQDAVVAADGERLARATAAEALRAPIAAAGRAETARADAAAQTAAALEEWEAASGDGDRDFGAVVERLIGDLAVWTVAAEQERELFLRERDRDEAQRLVSELADRLAALDAQRELLPAERRRLETALADARSSAARRHDLREREVAVADRLAAAIEAAELVDVVGRADAAHAAAARASATATARVAELVQRRMTGYAGELAAGLADGEPCAVCGSTVHPHPAVAATAPVTDDDLTDAETARDAALQAERETAETARRVRERHAVAGARAGGHEVETLRADHASAQAQVAAAEAAGIDVERLTLQRAEFDAAALTVEREREAASTRLNETRAALAALAATLATLRSEVERARGEHDSVADRVAAAIRERDLAQRCLSAVEREAETDRAVAAARDQLVMLIAGSQFPDAAAASAALLPADVRDAVQARVAEHAAALTATRARLLELEMEAAGADEVPDLAASERAAAEADTARTAAIAAERDARGTAVRLRDLLVQADGAYAEVSTLADDAAIVTRLADTVAGRAPNTRKMDLETFVLAAELEEIVAAANLRLEEMSSGRYTLHHSDARAARGRASGLGIEVLDAHTGQLRSPQSLSGGETFLASLALALGLAQVVTDRAGGLRLDTLFIDEGFGSLDAETLELAMRTLDELRQGGRTVGVISHVEAMKDQLPAQLSVVADAQGPSTIHQDVAARR